MIIALSIISGALAAWLAYRVLFYDSGDFFDGCCKFTFGLLRSRRRGIWQRSDPPLSPEQFEDEGWSSGIRFLLFVAVAVGCGYFAYHELQKHFG